MSPESSRTRAFEHIDSDESSAMLARCYSPSCRGGGKLNKRDEEAGSMIQ